MSPPPPDVVKLHDIDIEVLKEISRIKGELDNSLSTTNILSFGGDLEKVEMFCKETNEKLKEMCNAANNYIDSFENKKGEPRSTLHIFAEKYKLHIELVFKKLENLEKEVKNVLSNTNEAKRLQSSVTDGNDITRKTIDDKCNTAKGPFLGTLPVLVSGIISAFTTACISLKTIHQLLDESPNYISPTKEKTCYVVMFANSEYDDKTFLGKLSEVESDLSKAVNLFEHYEQFTFNKKYTNTTINEMKNILNDLRRKDFSSHSAIMVIYSGHGGRDIVYSKDSTKNTAEEVKKCELWDWVKQNGTICLQPVIVIFDACRGELKDDKICSRNKDKCGNNINAIETHPNIHNLLVVYATIYKNVAYMSGSSGAGSAFLPKLFDVFKEKEKWDILAQVTEATQRVLNYNARSRGSITQTVNFFNLLQKQLVLFSRENKYHDWSDMKRYQELSLSSKKLAIFLHPEQQHDLFAASRNKLSESLEYIGIEMHKSTFELSENFKTEVKALRDISILFIVVIGHNNCEDIHREYIPTLRSWICNSKCEGLEGVPKVIFFLGTDEKIEKNVESQSTTSQPSSKAGTKSSLINPDIFSTYSDVLCYCDFSADCLDSLQEILKEAPGHEEGLVRLLITRGMARQQALLTNSPSHIDSSLRYKLVLPKITEQVLEPSKIKKAKIECHH